MNFFCFFNIFFFIIFNISISQSQDEYISLINLGIGIFSNIKVQKIYNQYLKIKVSNLTRNRFYFIFFILNKDKKQYSRELFIKKKNYYHQYKIYSDHLKMFSKRKRVIELFQFLNIKNKFLITREKKTDVNFNIKFENKISFLSWGTEISFYITKKKISNIFIENNILNNQHQYRYQNKKKYNQIKFLEPLYVLKTGFVLNSNILDCDIIFFYEYKEKIKILNFQSIKNENFREHSFNIAFKYYINKVFKNFL